MSLWETFVRWKANTTPYFDYWHRWFAWYPVLFQEQWHWLENVLRVRRCHHDIYYEYEEYVDE